MDWRGLFKGGDGERGPLLDLGGDLVAAGDAARDRKDWKTAARAYRAHLNRDGSRADLWVQLGHALKESGDLRGAEAAYRSALERDETVADTHLQLGHLLKLTKRLPEAAAAYADAARLDVRGPHALTELQELSRRGVRLDAATTEALMRALREARRARRPGAQDRRALGRWLEQAEARDIDDETRQCLRAGLDALARLDAQAVDGEAAAAADATTTVVFDVSDLVSYFRHARLPTGIQRVQIEVIASLLRDPPEAMRAQVCAFTEGREDWVEVPPELMLDLAEMSLLSGALEDPVWAEVTRELQAELELARPLVFPQGAWLINLGTSWWLRNYFLKVRQARREAGVRYVPFVHDMIPVMAPEHCTRPLVQDFVSWALGVFAHAEHFLTNSEASKRDLLTVAARMGHAVDPDRVSVIPLDADFRKPVTKPVSETLERYGLTRDGYILFVSTIESRKNHLGAFQALSELIRRHGPQAVPKLVCVGNRGWLNDAVFQRLAADPALKKHVVMLSGVPDADLSNLYDGCLFALYPSSYEGWGLPVTEALCHGKAVMASDSSSIPEAGGRFAVYFRDRDQPDLTEKLERLILDADHRRAVEAEIQAHFQPRPWRALAEQIMTRIADWRAEAPETAPTAVPEIAAGRYVWLAKGQDASIGPGSMADEVFRSGSGWSAPDDWGCWTRPGGAEIQARIMGGDAPWRLFLGLLGLPGRSTKVAVSLAGEPVAEALLGPGESKWLPMAVEAASLPDSVMRLRVDCNDSRDLSDITDGVDRRRVSVGVIGFMICPASDMAARADFLEALTTNGLKDLHARQASERATRA